MAAGAGAFVVYEEDTMTHTPGPWVRDDSYTTGAINTSDYGVERGVGHHVALASVFGVPSGEWDANADLIAAAPELLAACERTALVFEAALWADSSDRGDSRIPMSDSRRELYQEICEQLQAAIAKARGEG